MSSRSINKVTIMGNVTADITMRTTQNGTPVASFSIATNRGYTDSEGNKQESAEFHNIVAFGKLAEICNNLLQKGSQILVEGRLQTRKWDDQDGKTNYKTEIVINEMYLLARGKPRAGGDNDFNDSSYVSGQASSSDDTVVDDSPSNDTTSKDKKSKDTKDEEVTADDIPF